MSKQISRIGATAGKLFVKSSKLSLMIGVAAVFVEPAVARAESGQGEPERTVDASADQPSGNAEQRAGQGRSDSDDVIVVTGTRIATPNLTSSVPVTSLTIQDLANSGEVSIGESLNRLPALTSSMGDSNANDQEGGAGLNILDLRGLGPQRTLVVVNGRRHVTGQPIGFGTGGVDVNTIPVALVERVDIVTGGSSAVYGSDAVTGVVNFILKRDFEGIEARAQTGLSSRGDRGSYFASLTAGRNFSGGRGNVAIAAEYAKQEPVSFAMRDDQFGAISGITNWVNTEVSFGEPASGNGVPDNQLISGLRRLDMSVGGLVQGVCPNPAGPNATPEQIAEIARLAAANCSGEQSPFGPLNNTYVFDRAGNLVLNQLTNDLRKYGSFFVVGGGAATGMEPFTLLAGVERASANLLAHFDVSDAFRPFVEAKFVRVNAQTVLGTSYGYPFNANRANPFLTAQAQQQLTRILPSGAQTFQVYRQNSDIPSVEDNIRRDTYRVVAGADGRFNEDWRYEVSLNYGHLNSTSSIRNNVDLVKMFQSANARRNSAGQIVCNINIDTNPNNDNPACVPMNIFGEGSPSKAAVDYFTFTSTRNQQATQQNALAYVAGDLSQVFELPGGPVSFVLGGEYRRETASSTYDAKTLTAITQIGASTFNPRPLVVKEAFGEIRIPLIADRPFFEQLSLEAAGRISDYNLENTGTVVAYNVSGSWAPVRDLRFRGSYAKAVRAPNLVELYQTTGNVFRETNDPCSAERIDATPFRRANCAALGVPTTMTLPDGRTVPFTNQTGELLQGSTGGNPDLEEERSTSFTLGGVFQPRAVRGLSVSIDYYQITLKNVIQAVPGPKVIEQCVDDPTGIDNQYCAAVFRNPDGTFKGQGTRIINGAPVTLPPTTGPAFFEGVFNYARLETSGIDVDVAYRANLGEDASLNLRGIVSYLFNRDTYTDIEDPTFRLPILSTLGNPVWEASLNANLDLGKVDFNYNMQYIGRQLVAFRYNDVLPVDDRPAVNPDQFASLYLPSITYHAVRVGFEPDDRFRFYVGVDNLFDENPPGGLDATTGGGGIWDFAGRYFYGGVNVKF